MGWLCQWPTWEDCQVLRDNLSGCDSDSDVSGYIDVSGVRVLWQWHLYIWCQTPGSLRDTEQQQEEPQMRVRFALKSPGIHLSKTSKEMAADKGIQQISVEGIITAHQPSSSYLWKLPEIPVWLMMKYPSIKNKDLTGILTNFKHFKNSLLNLIKLCWDWKTHGKKKIKQKQNFVDYMITGLDIIIVTNGS